MHKKTQKLTNQQTNKNKQNKKKPFSHKKKTKKNSTIVAVDVISWDMTLTFSLELLIIRCLIWIYKKKVTL